MSPVLKLTLGADFAFAARWALMQYHPWSDRRQFLDLSASDVEQTFHTWMKGGKCPWYIVDEFLAANGLRNRAGAGPTRARPSSAEPIAATPANEATQEEPFAPCTDHEVPSLAERPKTAFRRSRAMRRTTTMLNAIPMCSRCYTVLERGRKAGTVLEESASLQ